MNEPYYLIEASTEPRWLRVRPEQNGNKMSASILWTNNSFEAMQFRRREDAIAFLFLNPDFGFMASVTEHMDISNATTPTIQQGTVDDDMVDTANEAWDDVYDGVSHNKRDAMRAALTAALDPQVKR